MSAYNSGRLHHAWLISGPRGIGKATLAYRIARFLLIGHGDGDSGLFAGDSGLNADSLKTLDEHPVFQRIASGGHGNLRVVERLFDDKRKQVQSQIPVEQIRDLQGFFTKTVAEPGWRVAIVDAADEMNRNAANALLKLLEEPPRQSIILLVCHAPGKLPATIRSRCRHLGLTPVTEDAVYDILRQRMPELDEGEARSLAALSGGAPGRALMLAREQGLSLYSRLFELLKSLPDLDIPALHRLAQDLSAQKAENQYRLFTGFLLEFLARVARCSAGGKAEGDVIDGEGDVLAHLARQATLDRWMELWEKLTRLTDRADAVYLDRKHVVLALFGDLQQTINTR